MKINLKENIARLVFTFEGVEYNLTNKFGRIIEDPSPEFVAFVEATPELVIDADDESDVDSIEDAESNDVESDEGSKKKNSKKSKE